MKKYLAALAVVGLAVTGCAANEATKQTATTGASSSSTPAPTEGDSPFDDTAPPAVEETPTPTPEEPGIAKVGATEWFTYEDGLKVQVTKLTRFKIGEYAAGGKPGGTGVIVTVTIRNGTKKVFDANSVQINVTSGPNGDAADTVYDSDKALSGGFEGSVPAGRVKTAKAGFAVPAAHMKDVQVEIVPSYEHDPSFFEGAAK